MPDPSDSPAPPAAETGVDARGPLDLVVTGTVFLDLILTGLRAAPVGGDHDGVLDEDTVKAYLAKVGSA